MPLMVFASREEMKRWAENPAELLSILERAVVFRGGSRAAARSPQTYAMRFAVVFDALRRSDWNQVRAADMLGIAPSVVNHEISLAKKNGMLPEDFRSRKAKRILG